MKLTIKTERGLLMNNEHRKAGSNVIDGKEVTWNDADLITFISELDEKGLSKKYTIDPLKVNMVNTKLADTNWGSVIELTLNGKTVVDVEVVHDYWDNVPID